MVLQDTVGCFVPHRSRNYPSIALAPKVKIVVQCLEAIEVVNKLYRVSKCEFRMRASSYCSRAVTSETDGATSRGRLGGYRSAHALVAGFT